MPRRSPRWPNGDLLFRFNSLAEEAGYPGKHFDSRSPSRWEFLGRILDFVQKNLDLFRKR